MAENFLQMLGRHAPFNIGSSGKYFGVYTAEVSNIEHKEAKAQTEEEKGYRLKLKFPWLESKDESYWARVSTMMAGGGRGAFFMPDVGEEVLVAFEGGDFRYPIVIGFLWNGKDKYPQELTITPDNKKIDIPITKQAGKKNNYRFWHSREGHVMLFRDEPGKLQVVIRTNKSNEIVLDDTDGKEKIQIYDSKNENYMEIDTVKKKIMIESKTGEIHLKAFSTITLECKDLVTKSSKSTDMKAGTTWDSKAGKTMSMKSGQAMDLQAGATMTLKGGPKIDLNP